MKKYVFVSFMLIIFMNLYANYNLGMYIVDTGNNRIQKFTISNEFSISWGQYGREPGMFMSPSAIAISRDGNFIYVVDSANNRIQKFTSSGEYVLLWGGPEYGTTNGLFASPSCIAVNSENGQDYVYVADTGNNRIQKFDSSGNWIANWTGFNNPQGITTDYNYNFLYVADTGNNKIKKYDIWGNLIMEWGGYGSIEGKFRYPRDLAVDRENKVYVADGLNYRIQKFSSDGIYELSWGSKGSQEGQFLDQFGVSVDNDNNVYVADAGNNRIQKFTSSGEWIGNIGDINQGTGDGEFYYPMGIEVYLERPTPYPTEIIDTPTQEEIIPTPTFTWTFIPTETFTNTPSDEMGEENPEESKNTPTYTPTEILMETETPIPTENQETPVITPTQIDNQCVLFYSVEYGKKQYHFGKFKTYKMILKKFWKNIWNEKISIYENEDGGYIYEFSMFYLKILVYDPAACYLDEIETLIAMKNKFKKGHFYCWFAKKCMKKHYCGFDKFGNCGKCDDLFTANMEKNILKEAGLDNAISKEPKTNINEPLDETNVFNYPNPFRDSTTIRFSLDKQKDVKIIISDIAGKIVWQRNIIAYETRIGINYQEWLGVNDMGLRVANGVFLLKIITDEKTVIKKLVVIK